MFKLMVSAEGYQSLVTQLYFAGDKHIEKDSWASSPRAKKRILAIQSLSNGGKKVLFDVNLSKKLVAEPASIGKIIGTYSDEQNPSRHFEFFKQDNSLWVKNEIFGVELEYIDNNKFKPRNAVDDLRTYHFEILATGGVKLTYTYPKESKLEQVMALKK